MSLKDKLEQKVEKINSGNGEAAETHEQHTEVVVPERGSEHNGNLQPVSVVPQLAISLQEAEERIQLLQEFVKRYMLPDQDYGVIPGCQKPSLFKPGAEKLCDIYGLSKHVEIVDKVEDWDKPFVHYEVRVTLISKRSGHVEAQGVGSANSKEKKFVKQDTYSVVNNILKIAKKRALVDAVLSATRSSGVFTQDIEDLEEVNVKQSGTGPRVQEEKNMQNQSKRGNEKAEEEQLQEIYSLANELQLPTEQAKQMMQVQFGKENSRQLTSKEAADFIRRLRSLK